VRFKSRLSLLLSAIFLLLAPSSAKHFGGLWSVEPSPAFGGFRRSGLGDYSTSNRVSSTGSVILFIGDGMGPVQVEAACEAYGLSAFDRMAARGTVTTSSYRSSITDSAAAATALSTGTKTRNGVVGLGPDGRKLKTIIEAASEAGLRTGLITTENVTGATVAAFAAHVSSRRQELEIARQMAGARLDALLGGGRHAFMRRGSGRRKEGPDLLAQMRARGSHFVSTPQELESARLAPIVGLFAGGSLPCALDRLPGQGPTLAGMVRAALRVLSASRQTGRGFLLVAEEAHIDWACHGNDAAGCVAEVRELEQALREALDFAERRGGVTVIVTADHETGGMKIADHSRVHFLASVRASANRMAALAGRNSAGLRKVLAAQANVASLNDEEASRVLQARGRGIAIGRLVSSLGGVSWTSTGHTETPVPIYASGPGAQQCARRMDNTEVARLVAQCLGLASFTADVRARAQAHN
jgi:alkaline phosphatase